MASIGELSEPGHGITWCAGCGDFAILAALKMAISKLEIEPNNLVIASGIGCGSKLPHFIKTYGYESIHGRELAAASGIKLANHELELVVVAGDGDAYGIGMAHFIHGCRRNYNLTYIVHNNQIYGLTTGQTSPTSEKGYKSKSTPEGVIEIPVNPIALAIGAGATYVARAFSGDLAHMSEVIRGGLEHRGFALIDVLQPCVTWNKLNTFEYFKKKCYKLGEDYDPTDRVAAFGKAEEWENGIPIGVIYRGKRPIYEDELPALKLGPLAKRNIEDVNIDELMKEYE